MKNIRLLPNFMFIAALLWGCSEEVAVDPFSSSRGIRAIELNEIGDIEKMALKPDGGIATLSIGGPKVELPAGSADALAAAIAAAGPGGVVLVKSGLHTESGTVTITHRVRIIGEPGAILEVDTGPTDFIQPVEPALHILGAEHVVIWGLEIRPPSNPGGTAILVENSPRAAIAQNTLRDHQFSILLEEGNYARLWGNSVIATTAWQTGALPAAHGIVVINGDRVHIVNNHVSNGLFGVWACDQKGRYLFNTTQANFIGLILCTVPENSFPMPGGGFASSDLSGTQWFVANNQSTENFDAGYMVADNANTNMLVNNGASNNGTYDIELVGDSFRFGFLTPTAFDNTVIAGSHQNVVIKDCALNSVVRGGIPVDTSLDPCF